MPRRFLTALMLAAGSLAGSLLYRRRAARRLERVDLYADDGSMASIADGSPDAERLLTLATAAALELELPFVIVRNEAKEYGTANRIEGAYEHGDCVCLVEDVVTSGGAAIEAVEALREAGMRVSNAVCVVDREEGGADALARAAVRLRSLFTGSELRESAAKPHG